MRNLVLITRFRGGLDTIYYTGALCAGGKKVLIIYFCIIPWPWLYVGIISVCIVVHLLLIGFRALAKKAHILWGCAVLMVLWVLWLQKNARIFGHAAPPTTTRPSTFSLCLLFFDLSSFFTVLSSPLCCNIILY